MVASAISPDVETYDLKPYSMRMYFDKINDETYEVTCYKKWSLSKDTFSMYIPIDKTQLFRVKDGVDPYIRILKYPNRTEYQICTV